MWRGWMPRAPTMEGARRPNNKNVGQALRRIAPDVPHSNLPRCVPHRLSFTGGVEAMFMPAIAEV